MGYFVRKKAIQIPDSKFKIVKLYACTDESNGKTQEQQTERLQKPERQEIDLSGEKELSDPRCRELLEVVVESNFDAGDYVLSFTFPQQKDDDIRKKEIKSFLTRLSWAYHKSPTYVCRSERDVDGELHFTVLLRSESNVTNETLIKFCGKENGLNIGRIERDENRLLILPSLCYDDKHCSWSCSDDIKRSVVTVEDGTIDINDLKSFLQAKIGEDTTPIIRKMFGNWDAADSRFTSFEYGRSGIPYVEFRLIRETAAPFCERKEKVTEIPER